MSSHSLFCLSTPLLLPEGVERSLHTAKVGTSLPVHIKDLSFKATGAAVRQGVGGRNERGGIKNRLQSRLTQSKREVKSLRLLAGCFSKVEVLIYSVAEGLHEIKMQKGLISYKH